MLGIGSQPQGRNALSERDGRSLTRLLPASGERRKVPRSGLRRPPVKPLPSRRDALRQQFLVQPGSGMGWSATRMAPGVVRRGRRGASAVASASEACLSPVPMSAWTNVRMGACQKAGASEEAPRPAVETARGVDANLCPPSGHIKRAQGYAEAASRRRLKGLPGPRG